MIPIAAPDIGAAEEEAVLRVLRSGRLAQGPEVEAFEAEFAAASGVAHAVAVSNGTTALIAALQALGVEAGDEVLVPAFTFAATAGAVVATGAVPVFVDVDEAYHLDLDDAAAAVTARTVAVVPVHLYGLMVDMEAVAAFARRHGLGIVEDAAQAHLARRGGRVAGGTGVGAFSFYATKNMTTGEGGMVTTDDPEIADRLRLLRNHGMPERYVHTVRGTNMRMTDLQAAIGRVQLVKLPAATARRREIAARLDAELPEAIRRPPSAPDADHVYHQYTVAVRPDRRDGFLAGLRERGVGADVYYPRPLPAQPAFAGFSDGRPFPRAEEAAASVLSLPVHPRVDEAALGKIVAASVESLTSGARAG